MYICLFTLTNALFSPPYCTVPSLSCLVTSSSDPNYSPSFTVLHLSSPRIPLDSLTRPQPRLDTPTMSSPTMPSSPALTPTPIPFPALILAHGLLAGHPELLRLHAEHGGLTPPFDDAVLASCSNMVHTLTASRLPPAEEAVLLAWLAELSAHHSAHPTSIQVVAPPQLGNLRHQFLQRFRRSVSSLGGIRGRGTFGTVGVGVFAAGDTNTNTADVNAANANGTHTTTNANANTNTASPRHRPNLAIDTRAANTLLRRVHEVSQWSPYSTPTSPAGGSGSGAVEGNATPSPFGELESPAMTCGTTADSTYPPGSTLTLQTRLSSYPPSRTRSPRRSPSQCFRNLTACARRCGQALTASRRAWTPSRPSRTPRICVSRRRRSARRTWRHSKSSWRAAAFLPRT